jgi:hypothetical protein
VRGRSNRDGNAKAARRKRDGSRRCAGGGQLRGRRQGPWWKGTGLREWRPAPGAGPEGGSWTEPGWGNGWNGRPGAGRRRAFSARLRGTRQGRGLDRRRPSPSLSELEQRNSTPPFVFAWFRFAFLVCALALCWIGADLIWYGGWTDVGGVEWRTTVRGRVVGRIFAVGKSGGKFRASLPGFM